MDLSPLKPTLETDPLGLGFAPLLAAGNFNAVAAIVNDPAGKGAAMITLPSMANVDFVTAFLPYLKAALTKDAVYYGAMWSAILAMPTIDFTHANVSGALSQAVDDGVLTQAQAAALNQRTGSYAETLCGAGAAPSGSDISALFHPVS